MRLGRLGAPYAAPFEVVLEDGISKLRHYLGASTPPHDGQATNALLLVPPLMVTSEVYDISPELSAIAQLEASGLDVWLVDFGAPERTPGGLERTLDDHIRAVDRSIDEVRKRTGKDVHIAGYSQGGMFCYQTAALRRSEGIGSIITFGSPVDIRRNLPGIGVETAERLIAATRRAIEMPLKQMEGLPGFLTSTGFKLLSVRKEVQQLTEFIQKLHDRAALEKRESRRRFLAGEGFVAWPGPAFRTFVDEFIVHNRLTSGGFVIDGRAVTLADITCPILYFVGETDEIARAPAVRAIRQAAPVADLYEIPVRAGHFGLVVGSKARATTWPSVIEWVRWQSHVGPKPSLLARQEPVRARPLEDIDDESFDEVPIDIEAFYDVATTALDSMWTRLGEVGREVGRLIDSLRWQVPRLQKLRQIDPNTRISMGQALADQAAHIGENTFFLWKGRAFTYREADRRVDNIVRGLVHSGVRQGSKVGVLMETRPSYLSIVCALNRMGAVAVLLSPDSTRLTLEEAHRLAPMDFLVTDPGHAAYARSAYAGPVFVLGGGAPGANDARASLPGGVLDLESIDPDTIVLPSWYEPNAGRASELACIIFTAGRSTSSQSERKSISNGPKAARITNRRWAFSALGTAAACTLTSDDTVYCCLPLHHAAGMLVAVGGALIGGSRLALSSRFDPERLWPEVRRSGATIVFYAGDMLRDLVDAPPSPLDAHSPVRLFAGSGMRIDVWERLVARFGRASVLEFYGSTEGNAVLANASGVKIGALGRPLPGSTDLALLTWNFEKEDFARDENARLLMSRLEEPGVLIAKIDPGHASASFDGYLPSTPLLGRISREKESASRVLRGVFEPGDAWFVTGDWVRCDADGDHWFVDRLSDVVRSATGPIPTITIEDKLTRCPAVRRAAVYGVHLPGVSGQLLVAALVLHEHAIEPMKLGEDLMGVLDVRERPHFIRIVADIPMTDGYRMWKAPLREEGIPSRDERQTLVYDPTSERYDWLDPARFEARMLELRGGPTNKRPTARRR